MVAVIANFIPDGRDFGESKTGPNPNASFRDFSKIVALYLPSAR
jgi:hypothetical protein